MSSSSSIFVFFFFYLLLLPILHFCDSGQVRECSDLTFRLDVTESKMFASTNKELKKSQQAMEEKCFIISEQEIYGCAGREGKLRERLGVQVPLTDKTQEMSEHASTFFQRPMQETKHAEENDSQIIGIADLQKTYKAQSKSGYEKPTADLANPVSSHIRRQHEWVDNFENAVSSNKAFLDEHVSAVNNLANGAKRKWETFSREGAGLSAAKHCGMELLLQHDVDSGEDVTKNDREVAMGDSASSTRLSLRQSLGGASIADLLLRRDRTGAAILLASWVSVPIRESWKQSLVLLLAAILFLWAKSATVLSRPLPQYGDPCGVCD